MSTTGEPVPFEIYQDGVYLHGTKADLAVGDMLVPGRLSTGRNDVFCRSVRVMNDSFGLRDRNEDE